jgi:hypothetical protein
MDGRGHQAHLLVPAGGVESMKDKLIEIWLWVVAIAMTVVMVCSAMAWIFGIVVFVMRLING